MRRRRTSFLTFTIKDTDRQLLTGEVVSSLDNDAVVLKEWDKCDRERARA
jgi:hypothetical protein